MKYYQIEAIKSDNKLVERFFEDGRRFIKYIPFNPKIIIALKEQFKDKPIEVELNNGWIVITKTGIDETYKKAGEELMKGEKLTVERLAEEEFKMLKSVGYKVSLFMSEVDL